jgi:hypothetical protein
MYRYVKPGNGGGEAAAFVLGLSSCVLVIVYATVAFLTFRQKMRNAKHQGPETEISFYENAKEAIDNWRKVFPLPAIPIQCQFRRLFICTKTKQELDRDAFVIMK